MHNDEENTKAKNKQAKTKYSHTQTHIEYTGNKKKFKKLHPLELERH